MSKMKDALRNDVEARFGEGAGKAIEYLFENGVLDDSLARKHFVKVEAFRRIMTSKADEKQIHSDISEDCGLSISAVYKMCRDAVY